MKKKEECRPFNYSKINGRTAELGYTKKDVAAAAGMTPATYGIKLSGKSDFTRSEIIKIMDFLGIDPAETAQYFFCVDC